MFGVINSETQSAWQAIARDVSRQRPIPGRRAFVFRGRKMLGSTVTILRHQQDAYDRTAFRYGTAASLHLREMCGRSGFVCMVQADDGTTTWIKAEYLACECAYKHWTVALADAVLIGLGWAPPKKAK